MRGTWPGTEREALAWPILFVSSPKQTTMFSFSFQRGVGYPPAAQQEKAGLFFIGRGQIQDLHFWLRGFFLLGRGVANPPPTKEKARLSWGVRKKYGPWPGPGGPGPAQNVGSGTNNKNGLNRFQNHRFGLKIVPEACQYRSGACRTGPAANKK